MPRTVAPSCLTGVPRSEWPRAGAGQVSPACVTLEYVKAVLAIANSPDRDEFGGRHSKMPKDAVSISSPALLLQGSGPLHLRFNASIVPPPLQCLFVSALPRLKQHLPFRCSVEKPCRRPCSNSLSRAFTSRTGPRRNGRHTGTTSPRSRLRWASRSCTRSCTHYAQERSPTIR